MTVVNVHGLQNGNHFPLEDILDHMDDIGLPQTGKCNSSLLVKPQGIMSYPMI